MEYASKKEKSSEARLLLSCVFHWLALDSVLLII